MDCPAEVNNTQTLLTEGVDKKIESSSENILVNESGEGKAESSSRPFAPFTTEDLRQSILQIWKNVNSPVLNGWDGELTRQPEEIVHLMEELSTIQVTANESSDPNRPRVCNLLDEDVKKMFVEIGKMNFKSNSQNDVNADALSNQGTKDEAGKSESQSTAEPTENEVSPKREESKLQVTTLASPSVTVLEAKKINESNDLEVNGAAFEMSITECDEEFMDSSESVIQIIDPQEDSNEETEEGGVTFSLPDDSELGQYNGDEEFEEMERQNNAAYSRVQSGMTTVGPMKNLNYDPKLLTWSEIDYGKMTRITGSRELKKQNANDSVYSSTSRKTYDDSEEDQLMVTESGYVEYETIVNHDIASLTKVQRVNEVLSDQPKSVEDFKEDEKVMRSPLDLKDVDAESVESYNVIGNNRGGGGTSGADNQLGLDDDDDEGKNTQQIVAGSKLFGNEKKAAEEPATRNDESPQIPLAVNQSTTGVNVGHSQKHNTISRVFQKASSKFLMKDDESFVRSSKSLPRDSGKSGNPESIKSLLDEYQTSAAAVLRKSRSLLKNTQNVLKVVSKTGFGHSNEKQHSDSNVGAMDQSSSSSKKNEFLSLKDTIKNKVGKTLKSLENITSSDDRKNEAKGEAYESSKMGHSAETVLVSVNPQSRSGDNAREPRDSSEPPGQSTDRLASGIAKEIRDETDAADVSKEIEVLCDVKFQRNNRCSAMRTHSNSVPADLNNDIHDDEHGMSVQMKSTDGAVQQRPSSHTIFGSAFVVGNRTALPLEGVLQEELVAVEGGDLHKSLSNSKLRRKNKLSARIRSFWQAAFGKVKATSQKKDVS
ncbi:UNVERIFIED_CONTAM: hypothetical protein PYX00_007867 [Menopon gallinae]|uniref:Uncharacterized protein n=1 Tax=Menopon gallinae TaxID=328185 RepID=A0AAW2HKX0_9NEOP